jgi:cardiolipin synthase
MYKTDCIADIEKDFLDTLAKCRVVTAETIKNEKFSYKLMGGLAKMIAPLM